MFRDPKPDKIDNWVCVLEKGTEYEVELARSYLANLKIPSNILSKRDRSYSLNIGEMSMVYLYVPVEFEKKARAALAGLSLSDYVLQQIELSLERPTRQEVLERIQSRTAYTPKPRAAKAVRQERDAR